MPGHAALLSAFPILPIGQLADASFSDGDDWPVRWVVFWWEAGEDPPRWVVFFSDRAVYRARLVDRYPRGLSTISAISRHT